MRQDRQSREQRPKTKRRFNQKMQTRAGLMIVLLFVGFSVVVGHMILITMGDGEAYKKQVLTQQTYSSRTIAYQRGEIRDRNGNLLATNTKLYNLILEPKIILEKNSATGKYKYKEDTLKALETYFGMGKDEVEQVLKENEDSFYYIAKKGLSYEEVNPYNEFLTKEESEDVKGIDLEEEYERVYPNDALACQLIGYTSAGNVGTWGIEQYYNDELNGVDGRTYGYLNDDSEMERVYQAASDGDSVVSTIDVSIQRIIENHLQKFMSEVGALNASVVAMNPNNGEVLALANSASYDLNDPYNDAGLLTKYTKEDIDKMTKEEKLDALNNIWRNYVISNTYEPGSTYKPFTVAGALEEDVINDGDTFDCGGYLTVGDYDIYCHNTAGDGRLTVEQAIMQSCNVSLMRIASAMGKDLFTKYQQDIFGFGNVTNIDLPGEEAGLIYTDDKMGITDLATNSFGQNFNCTMIQLASGFCSLVNGGNYYKPHVVKQVVNAEGGVVKSIDKELVKKTISKDTSDLIKEYLYQTVEQGTGVKAKIAGYTIGGKTGTAEKLPRDKKHYLVSFVSFASVEEPEVMLYITIDEPHTIPLDNAAVATQLTHDIYQELLPYMNISQTEKQEKKEEGEQEATTEATASTENAATTEDAATTEAIATTQTPVVPEETTTTQVAQ